MSATRDVITMSESIPPFDELPELMLSLRSIGSRRSWPNDAVATEEEQQRYFAPLLDARRTASKALTRQQVIVAFDGRRITALIDATIRAFAAERFAARAPARRAFEAELFEIVEPLRDALQSLRALADASGGAEDSPELQSRWPLWLAQLRVVFRVADSRWPALSEALSALPVDAKSSRRRRSSGGEERP
jgi:hypothetical protein